MIIPRRAKRLSDYHSILDRRGDVEIGVQARRRWWRNLFMAIVGTGMIVAAGWLFYVLQPPQETGGQANGYTIKMQCTECGYTAFVYVKYDQKFPLICPRCKLRSFRQVWRCKIDECGCEFIPPPKATEIKCPQCGSISVGAVEIEDEPPEPPKDP